MSKAKQVDPFTVTTEEKDEEVFKSLDFWGQFDAAVNNASKADVKNLPLFFIGGIYWCLLHTFLLGVTWYLTSDVPFAFSSSFFFGAWTTGFHEQMLKNIIAFDGILHHNSFALCYRVLVGAPEAKIKHMPGSIKEPHSGLAEAVPIFGGKRRTIVDVVMHIVWDLARVWLIVSAEPSPACAWLVFGTMAWMYLFDYGEYIGLYGMYHGPWSVFILAKYYSADGQAASVAVLQTVLIYLYVGCGLGKMGPWFVAVFAQEWTLPPWGATLDLRSFFYNPNFPRDNTTSSAATLLGYVAAAAEWIAPLMIMATASVVGADAGSSYVYGGIFVIIAMHFYINFHIPPFDVWMLNFTPAYLVYNVFYLCPTLPEPGFDYAAFDALHPGFRYFLYAFGLFIAYGQMMPEKMCYMLCYRFWAGNWPQSWVLVSGSGMAKLLKAFPVQGKTGKPGGSFSAMQGKMWAFNFLGIFQTAQLPHRIMPMVIHKALKLGAKQRGDTGIETLTDLQDADGLFTFGSMFFNWVSGYMVNDALRGEYVMTEMQSMCNFEPGELQLIQGSSYPLFASLYGGQSHWTITDAKKGVVAEGWIGVNEALAVTKPSDCANYLAKEQ